MWCCRRLASAIDNAGERGIAIVVRRVPESFIYYLQCRAVPFGDEAKLAQQRIEQRVTILSTVGIRFCPWCGRRLDDLAQAAPDLFTELAERHEGFVPDV